MTRVRSLKSLQWYILLSVLLVGFSAFSYFIQILIFHRTEDTFFYMLQDIAFVPIQVLLVTLIISRLLTEKERRSLLKKMNMLVGAFYSEVGTYLIKYCSGFSGDLSELRRHMQTSAQWTGRDFTAAIRHIRASDPRLDSRKNGLAELRIFLEGKRGFLLSLLANPNLLEHDAFTDLLWAVFHLLEELSARPSLTELPRVDYDHLTGDIERVYSQLLVGWLTYMKHLKGDYPYLFSLAARMNPLDAHASAVIKE